MLAGRATAEVSGGNDDVTGLDPADEVRVNILHAVSGEFRRCGDVEVAGGDNGIGINVSAVFVRGSF